MSSQNITTLELIDELAAAGYKAYVNDDNHGTHVVVYEGSEFVGSARADEMYSMKVNTNTATDYRKYVLDTLYRYASTPLDRRKEQLYKMRIEDTSLYLIHINEVQMTITSNERAAKAYIKCDADEAYMLANKQGVILSIEEIKNATN